MPTITIDETTFANLRMLQSQRRAVTPAAIVEQLVRQETENCASAPQAAAPKPLPDGLALYEVAASAPGPPQLSHMKPVRATLDGIPVARPNWNKILRTVIKIIDHRGVVGAQLQSELGGLAKVGKHIGNGLTYVAEAGVTVRGQSAECAWRAIARPSSQHGISVRIEYAHRDAVADVGPCEVSVLTSGPREGLDQKYQHQR
ncbi:hypothetical protein AYJ57_13710 [Salipiger sp. CCB-MM3]|uniref:hypothetical protein n=1 Tax=Salipiger sp. CCB-MM3 TaxID=1792508 RepID=UPI00080AA4BF|nr:hypothetical protein [Salipiger sp. CCB-MM3]ANT61337.1 hypothetical protein AYJ57_13710 [Salipiger sp. CCB-MM3]